MNEQERIWERLTVEARKEVPPTVDVAHATWARIREPRMTADPIMAAMAGLSALAAAVVLMYAGQAWSMLHDPLTGLLAAMDPVLQ